MTKHRITVEQAIEFSNICAQNVRAKKHRQAFNDYLGGIADGSNLNFSGKQLHSSWFNGAVFDGADFSGANLNGTNFEGASLKCVNLIGAQIGANAKFKDADVAGALIFDTKGKYPVPLQDQPTLPELREKGAITSVEEFIEDFRGGNLATHPNYCHAALQLKEKYPQHAEELNRIAEANHTPEMQLKAAAHLVPVIRGLPLPGTGTVEVIERRKVVSEFGMPLPLQVIIAKNTLRNEWVEASMLSDVQLENLIGAVLSRKTLLTAEDLTLAATALKEAEQPKQPEAKAENGKGCLEKKSWKQKLSSKLRRSHKKDAPVNDNAQEKQVFATAMDKKIWEILNGQEQKQGRVMGAE